MTIRQTIEINNCSKLPTLRKPDKDPNFYTIFVKWWRVEDWGWMLGSNLTKGNDDGSKRNQNQNQSFVECKGLFIASLLNST